VYHLDLQYVDHEGSMISCTLKRSQVRTSPTAIPSASASGRVVRVAARRIPVAPGLTWSGSILGHEQSTSSAGADTARSRATMATARRATYLEKLPGALGDVGTHMGRAIAADAPKAC
jgi:hypothetical protein